MRSALLLPSILICFSGSPAAGGEIYRWVDEQGNVRFSDVPPPSGTGSQWEPSDGRIRVVPEAAPGAASGRHTPPLPGSATAGPERRGTEEQIGGHTRDQWRRRHLAARSKVGHLEKRLQDLEEGPQVVHRASRHKGVWYDGENTAAERVRLEREIAVAKAELQKIEDEARRAGVPPGWLR